MKIKCEYCGTLFEDTLTNCPSCGKNNPNVRRSTKGQPITIEELKQWYVEKGLPPEETTRFFIGKNYTGPRAFGIYRDEQTGNFVVYKNKADGTRAIRYEGTDEAYAVNELHMRLKQEILEQKSNNISRGETVHAPVKKRKIRRRHISAIPSFVIVLIIVLIIVAVGFLPMWLVSYVNKPSKQGYYQYNESESYRGKLFYHYGSNSDGWVVYDTEIDDWKKTSVYPGRAFSKEKNAKKYFLSYDYDPSYGATDFSKTELYQDYLNGFKVNTGYYAYEDDVYYHMKQDSEHGWYVYDDEENDWDEVFFLDVPKDLTHTNVASDFWFTPEWDMGTQMTDFEKTDTYLEYQEELREQNNRSYNSNDSNDSWDSDDDDYDWDSDDSWDSNDSDWDSDW